MAEKKATAAKKTAKVKAEKDEALKVSSSETAKKPAPSKMKKAMTVRRSAAAAPCSRILR